MDRAEARKFIFAVFDDMFDSDSLRMLEGDGFENVFDKLDSDGSGTIDKREAIAFIKALSGQEIYDSDEDDDSDDSD